MVLFLEALLWLLMVAGGFLGSNYRMWKILEVMQTCSALYFVNVRSFPLNLGLVLDKLLYSNLSVVTNPVA